MFRQKRGSSTRNSLPLSNTNSGENWKMSVAFPTMLPSRLVIFRLDGARYALPLDQVVHIVRAAEITALENAPGLVLGVIDLAGQIVPVVDIRQRFGLEPKDLLPSHHFIIAQAGERLVSLIVDEAEEVSEISASQFLNTSEIIPGLEHITGVARLEDGLVLIHDLETFLSQEEARDLDRAMKS